MMLDYFFTEPDPDYKLKGSRDPLGLQVIWRETGQQIVPFLSTVSTSLKDFQTITYAWYFQNRETHHMQEPEIGFFLRFEQACAYARYTNNQDDSFNGKDKVRKLHQSENQPSEYTLHAKDNQLLSNQKAYGIWGKYIRPFRDLKIYQDEQFYKIIEDKINTFDLASSLYELIERIKTNEKLIIYKEDLQLIYLLINKISPDERDLYTRTILQSKVSKGQLQNELYNILSENIDDIPAKNLYQFTEFLKNKSSTELFKEAVIEIERTEDLICPLNRIFRLLQTQPYGWTKDEINDNEFLSIFNNPLSYHYKIKQDTKSRMNQIFDHDNWSLIGKLTNWNTQVSERRGSIPWIAIEKNELKINSNDGAHLTSEYKQNFTFDNYYLLDSYINLFKEITSINE